MKKRTLAVLMAGAMLLAGCGGGGSASLKESIAKYPYFFSSLNFSDTQAPALADIFKEQGITSAYVVYIEDLHGTEYSQAVIPALVSVGCDIKGVKSVPADIQDMTSIIQDAQNSGADAFLCLTYPDQGFLALNQSIALDYNPKVWFMGSGGGFSSILDLYGKDTVEGIMSWGAWNTKSSPACAEYFEHFKEYWKDDPNVYYDYWGLVHYYAGLQCLQNACALFFVFNPDPVSHSFSLLRQIVPCAAVYIRLYSHFTGIVYIPHLIFPFFTNHAPALSAGACISPYNSALGHRLYFKPQNQALTNSTAFSAALGASSV